MNHSPSIGNLSSHVPLFHSLGNGTVEQSPGTLISQGIGVFQPVEHEGKEVEQDKPISLKELALQNIRKNKKWRKEETSGKTLIQESALGIHKQDKALIKSFPERESKSGEVTSTWLNFKLDIKWNGVFSKAESSELSLNDLSSKEIFRYLPMLERSYLNPSHDVFHYNNLPQKFRDRTITFEEIEEALTKFIYKLKKWESSGEYPLLQLLLEERDRDLFIILSYPEQMRPFLKSLADISKMTPGVSGYDRKSLSNFCYNMKHMFKNMQNYPTPWAPPPLFTLWRDRWRDGDIIRFMMSEKVKYILCHDTKIIQCLKLDGSSVYIFKKPQPDVSLGGGLC